nr:MAG TPA: hypothetical protein [Microviridae sp.]
MKAPVVQCVLLCGVLVSTLHRFGSLKTSLVCMLSLPMIR